MSRHAEQKLAASEKRLVEKIDETKSYVNGERECDQDQLRKTKSCRKSWKLE